MIKGIVLKGKISSVIARLKLLTYYKGEDKKNDR